VIVVLDTNVIISALLSPSGVPAEIIRRWEANAFEVVVSPELIKELESVLEYPRVSRYLRLSSEQRRSFLKGFVTVAALVEPHSNPQVVRDNPGDNKVLACALAGGADYIVSGDRHLLDLKEYQGIVILPPSAFLLVLDLDNGG
jgi:putative PIN family toxin of toxin-antitoxin system